GPGCPRPRGVILIPPPPPGAPGRERSVPPDRPAVPRLAVRAPVPRAGAAAAPSHAARAGTAQPRLGDGPAPRGEPAQPAAESGPLRRRRARPDLSRARRRRRAQRPGGRARGDLLPADRGGQRIRHLARRAGAPLEAWPPAGAGVANSGWAGAAA